MELYGKGAFIRLSTLSPKDAVLDDNERLFPYIIEELKKVEDRGNKYELEIAVATAIGKSLQGNSSNSCFLLELPF